jgi:MFS family permease
MGNIAGMDVSDCNFVCHAGIVANFVTARYGRRVVMIVGGGAFLVGTGLLAGAAHISMLFIGRVCWGVGVGFANQAVPVKPLFWACQL